MTQKRPQEPGLGREKAKRKTGWGTEVPLFPTKCYLKLLYEHLKVNHDCTMAREISTFKLNRKLFF